jgi:hypothetical protein
MILATDAVHWGSILVQIDPEEFRRRYAELSDEGLLSIDRDELVEVALQCYDDELARRGLQPQPQASAEVAEMDEELLSVATFLFPDGASPTFAVEASFGLDSCRSAR